MAKRNAWSQRFMELQLQARDERLQRYYGEGMMAADTPISAAPLVALDFETTGLDPDHDDIVSIGLVPFSSQRIYCRESAHWLIKPTMPLAEESVVIHGITHSDVTGAPSLNLILDELLQALAGKLVVVHCQDIERPFLAKALQKRLKERLDFPVIDTMALERRALLARQGMLGRLLKKPIGSLRLADCRQRYCLPFYHAHHALTDALATAELLQAQLAYHHRPEVTVGELWS
ncbi:3'-5' exonuclease [Gallaecimonas sp. GXIMD4217]|uniref:3'-5' exonuclease n=1 Tax=Gallaecimonas sp. GXIMD4217 TaxID=3131927 RepID=UPI00311B3A01